MHWIAKTGNQGNRLALRPSNASRHRSDETRRNKKAPLRRLCALVCSG